jgi:hypothetical protein
MAGSSKKECQKFSKSTRSGEVESVSASVDKYAMEEKTTEVSKRLETVDETSPCALSNHLNGWSASAQDSRSRRQ